MPESAHAPAVATRMRTMRQTVHSMFTAVLRTSRVRTSGCEDLYLAA